MKGYSEREVFSEREITQWQRATRRIDLLPSLKDMRCHELARAVGRFLDLPYQDGFYGFVDHTWLWTAPVPRTIGRLGFPNILDVYAVGGLPMVRLVACDAPSLPHVGWSYRPGSERDDIDEAMVDDLVVRLSSWDEERRK